MTTDNDDAARSAQEIAAGVAAALAERDRKKDQSTSIFAIGTVVLLAGILFACAQSSDHYNKQAGLRDADRKRHATCTRQRAADAAPMIYSIEGQQVLVDDLVWNIAMLDDKRNLANYVALCLGAREIVSATSGTPLATIDDMGSVTIEP